MNVPIEVALGDGDPPIWNIVHIRSGVDAAVFAKRCALVLGVDPEEFPTLLRADRGNAREAGVIFAQPFAKFLLIRKHLNSPKPLTVLGCGDDSNGQLGRKAKPLEYHEARPIPGLLGRRVIQISAGDEHSAFLLEIGSVLTCGNATFGRLGQGGCLTENHQLVPRRVEMPHKSSVVHVNCSGARTFCVTADGSVLVFGEKGAPLGLGEKFLEEDALTPMRIPLSSNIQKLSSSNNRVLALSIDGRTIFSWGIENDGARHSPEEGRIDLDKVIKDISAGSGLSNFSLLALHDGSFMEMSSGLKPTLSPIQHINNTIYHDNSIACGGETSFIVSAEEGAVIAVNSTDSFVSTPLAKLRHIRVKQGGKISKVYASTGSNNVVFITDEKRVFGIGCSSKGQLTTLSNQVHEPIWLGGGLDCIDAAAVGSRHTLLLYSSYVSPLIRSEHETDKSETPLPKTNLLARGGCSGVDGGECVLS